MSKALLLDTHVFIWLVNGSDELTEDICKLINAAAEQSAISLWETSMLAARSRISLTLPCDKWLEKALALTNTQVANLTPAIAAESCNLPGVFQQDPADRLIVATARINKYNLITRDEKILAYSASRHVSTIKA